MAGCQPLDVEMGRGASAFQLEVWLFVIGFTEWRFGGSKQCGIALGNERSRLLSLSVRLSVYQARQDLY